MNIKIIILSTILLFYKPIQGDKTYLILRNKYLRLYVQRAPKEQLILDYFNKYKNIVTYKINILYNSILSKYYDINLFYYSLSDEEKILFDNVFALMY
jgi:hypothetical protein